MQPVVYPRVVTRVAGIYCLTHSCKGLFVKVIARITVRYLSRHEGHGATLSLKGFLKPLKFRFAFLLCICASLSNVFCWLFIENWDHTYGVHLCGKRRQQQIGVSSQDAVISAPVI